jgi:type I restriction enzyme S subunit
VPKLRFPGFKEHPSAITLLEVCNGEISNGVFNDPGKRDGSYRLVNVLNMFGSDQIDVSSLSALALERKEFEKNKVKYGDIFFTRSSLVPAGIAWSNVFLSRE